ncbi:MAG: hypothetical protein J6U15_01875 [Lachnospiraceae bacterium]|nr:hypothetical protein [Lachnospiraceae bacterium]
MKKSTKIITSAVTAAALLLGVSGAVYASESNKTTENETAELNEIAEETVNTGKYEMDETFSMDDEVAYVFTNYDGSVNKVMDSIWIEDGNDKTEDGSEAKLPVDLKVSYELDGVNVTPSEIEGKDGHLKITCEFTDNQYEMKDINGKEEKIYVPYLASLVTVMDDETYSNVTVSSGKVTYDGTRYAILGLAFPGLSEDVGDAITNIDIPNKIELEADVKDCEPAGLYLLVSDSVFSNLDLDTDSEVGKLTDAMGQLSDAVKQLMDGSSKLYDGLGELENGAGQISDGVNRLSDGLNQIDANSAALNDGALQVFNALLATATQQINAAGVSVPALTVSNYNDVINGAINQISGTDVAGMARSQVEAGVKQYANEHASENIAAATNAARSQVEAQVRAGAEAQVRAQVEANRGLIEQQVRAQVEGNRDAIMAQVKAGVLAAQGIDDYDSLDDDTKAAIDAAVDAKTSETIESMVSENVNNTVEAKVSEVLNSAETQAAITANIDSAMGSDEVKAGIQNGINDKINQAINEKYNSAEVQSQIAAGNAKVSSGVQSLRSLQNQLNSYAQFYQGIQTYTGAVGQAAAGAGKLKDAMPEFVQGVEALRNGQGQLSDGIKKFDEDGIEELNGVVEDNVEGLAERFAAMTDVAADHNKYDESGSEKNGVKFIYKVSVSD